MKTFRSHLCCLHDFGDVGQNDQKFHWCWSTLKLIKKTTEKKKRFDCGLKTVPCWLKVKSWPMMIFISFVGVIFFFLYKKGHWRIALPHLNFSSNGSCLSPHRGCLVCGREVFLFAKRRKAFKLFSVLLYWTTVLKIAIFSYDLFVYLLHHKFYYSLWSLISGCKELIWKSSFYRGRFWGTVPWSVITNSFMEFRKQTEVTSSNCYFLMFSHERGGMEIKVQSYYLRIKSDFQHTHLENK